MEYFEAPLKDYVEGPPPAALSTPVPAAVATEQLTIKRMMSLKMMELKEELRKRGRSMVGKKGVLQDRLREAILLNVPVDFGNEAHHHESMSGLDVCCKPSDQPRDAARQEECSNRMKRVLLLFVVVMGGRKGFARGHQNGFYET